MDKSPISVPWHHGGMTSRESPAEEAVRKARKRVTTAITEIRSARIGAGLSQGALGAGVAISRSRVSRIEREKELDVPAELLIRLATVVGLDLPLKVFPGGDPTRDAGQRRLLDRLRIRLGPVWEWEHEVALPIVGDKRAWDAVGTHATTRFVIHLEAETRLEDVQALLRRLALKCRDGAAVRLILVVSDTRNNRAVIRAAAREFALAFPVDARRALSLLSVGEDPGGNVLLVI